MKQVPHIQQGDTLYFKESIPANISIINSQDGIVQFGEHTGHAHRLMFRHGHGSESALPDCKQWEMFKDGSGIRYLKINDPTDLTHEEHKTITLPPGEYRIGIVQEYDHFLEEARAVQD